MHLLVLASLAFMFFVQADVHKLMSERAQTLRNLNPAMKCHGGGEDVAAGLDQGLKLNISCAFTCQDNQRFNPSLEDYFVPVSLGLKPGNGSGSDTILWGGLGATLNWWAWDRCLVKGQALCGDISRVKKMEQPRLKSGKWQLDQPTDCSSKTVVQSPFDASSGAELLNPLSLEVSKRSPQESLLQGIKLSSDLEIKNCHRKAKAFLCFGDCVDLRTEQLLETIATPEPLGSFEEEICLDDILPSLQKLKMNPDLLNRSCEKLVLKKIIQNYKLYASCAAIRANVDCGIKNVD